MENNGLQKLFNDLMSGQKTSDQVTAELEKMREDVASSPLYLKVGRNFKALTHCGFTEINGVAVNLYESGEKINIAGEKVEPKSRATTTAGTGRKKKGA